MLLLVLSPHLGLLLLSFATVWCFSPLPDGLHARPLRDACSATARVYIKNTLLYAALAALIDVVLGTAIAYLILRTRLPGRAMARLGRVGRARHPRRRARHRLSAHVLRRRAARRHAARHVVDHDRAGARGPAPAVCAARLLRGAAADLGVARGGGREPRRHQGAHRPAHRRAADDGRHPRRLRHQLHHRGGRAVGDDDAGAVAIATRRWPTASTSTCSRRPGAARARRSASSPSCWWRSARCLSHLVDRAHRNAPRGLRPEERHDNVASAGASSDRHPRTSICPTAPTRCCTTSV